MLVAAVQLCRSLWHGQLVLSERPGAGRVSAAEPLSLQCAVSRGAVGYPLPVSSDEPRRLWSPLESPEGTCWLAAAQLRAGQREG